MSDHLGETPTYCGQESACFLLAFMGNEYTALVVLWLTQNHGMLHKFPTWNASWNQECGSDKPVVCINTSYYLVVLMSLFSAGCDVSVGWKCRFPTWTVCRCLEIKLIGGARLGLSPFDSRRLFSFASPQLSQPACSFWAVQLPEGSRERYLITREASLPTVKVGVVNLACQPESYICPQFC